jgi:uncharacterized membrane protein
VIGRESRVADAVVAVAASTRLAWLLVLVGALLRIAQYASGRSLWLDESYLALNVLTKSYHGLLGTLKWEQGAPPGFLLVTKMLVGVFGSSEAVFRFLPLVAGLVSLVLFHRLARLSLAPAAANGAIAFFAVNNALIRYSSEVKPYEVDVAATLAVLVLGVTAWQRGFDVRDSARLAAGGLVAVFLSYAAVLAIATVLVAAAIAVALGRRREAARGFALVAGVWGATFAVVYAVFLPNVHRLQTRSLTVFYLPLPPTSAAELHRLASALGGELSDTAGVGLPVAIAVLAGVLIVLSPLGLARRSPFAGLAVILLVVVVVIAAGADRYPWGGRYILFLVPVLLIGVLGGASALGSFRGGAVAATVLVLVVLAVPVAEAAYHLFVPRKIEEAKPLIVRLAQQWRHGDTLYLNASAQYAFRYYSEYRGLDERPSDSSAALWPIVPAPGGEAGTAPALRSVPPSFLVAAADVSSQALARRVERLATRRPRVWVLLTHIRAVDRRPFEQPSSSVRLVEADRTTGGALYLFEPR